MLLDKNIATMEEERNPDSMQQVQQILDTFKLYDMTQNLRPGQHIVGEWREYGFHPTGVVGEYELDTLPNEWMANCAEHCIRLRKNKFYLGE